MNPLEPHYKILELNRSASPQEMKAAYRRLIKEWHPDQFVQDVAKTRIAEEKVKQINLAYSVLKRQMPRPHRSRASDDVAPPNRVEQTHTQIHERAVDPTVYYQQAKDNLHQEDYAAATECLSVAIRIKPDYAEAYRFRGFIYSLQGYERRAESDLRKAAELSLESSVQSPPASPAVESPIREKKTTPQRSRSHPHSLESWSSFELGAHDGAITCLAASRTILASAGLDGKLNLWNLKNKKFFCTLYSGSASIHGMQFSADGQFLVSGFETGEVTLWHVPTGSPVRSFAGEFGPIQSLVVNQTQKIVIAGTQTGVVLIWDLKTGQLIQKLVNTHVSIESIQYVPKLTTLIAACHDGVIRTWDFSRNYAFKRFEIQDNAMFATGMNAEGERLIVAGEDGTIRSWSILTGISGSSIESDQGAIYTLATNSDFSRFASGGADASVYIRTMADGSLVADLRGHQQPVTASLFWGSQLITGSTDHTIRFWR